MINVIDYLSNHEMSTKALDIAHQHNCKDKIDEIHYQSASRLEENNEFGKAKQEFVECNKAKQALK